MKTIVANFLLVACLTLSSFGQGTIAWNEAVDGQLSRDGAHPTSLGIMQIGTNIVFSSVEFEPVGGGPGGILFSDFFTISIGADSQVTDIFLTVDRPIAVWIGDTTFSTELASIFNPASGSLLTQLGLNLLQTGEFGIYVSNNQLGSLPSSAPYELDFFVQAVPEPGTFSLLLLGAGFFGFHGWRKFRFKAK